MTRIIAIAMQKGGVGKTTTAINLAAALTRLGQRVLAIDLDPQGNLTQHIGFDPDQISPTVYDSLKAEVDGLDGDIGDAIYETAEGFHILPSQPELSLVEVALINTLSRERVLATLLEDIADDYDFILIDCNPSLGLLVINALTAADGVIVPIQTEYLAARGAFMILSSIETVRRKKLNPTLEIEGIILTMADTRTLLTQDVLTAVNDQFGENIHIFDP
ncbi:MAG: ParA family protein, partial [Anaerolineales bacterium]|nr:ParA family protein [Anaerolineales bacterium]